MKDRLRAARDAAAELAERAQRLVPGGNKSEVDDPSDDEDDDDLDPVDVSDPADAELSRLDEEDADPIAIDTAGSSLFDLLRKIDPTPPLPLTAAHEAGFVSLLHRLDETAAGGLLADGKVRRILDLVGDRLSVTVGPDGITVRGLLRRRRTAWKHVQKLTFEGRYDLVRGDGLAKITDDIKGKVGLPIPGLGWLIRKVVNGISNWLEERFFTEDQVAGLRQGSGNALLAIQRRGRDIELSGPLLLVSILAPGLSEALEHEARARGIDVEIEVSAG